jgi:uncharacterized protein YdeI (YjbR/CyaY-like superfamily)
MPPQLSAPPTFFPTPAHFRAWLAEHSSSEPFLIVGFHTTKSGLPSLTWPQSVDEALCYGWIDGVRKNIDATSYQIRFTPRKPRSHWSAVNIARVAALTQEGRMQPAGLAAFALRTEARTAKAAYEQPQTATLPPDQQALFESHPAAWAFFQSQAPSYRKTALHYVTTAKQPATRQSRLQRLIEASAQLKRL